MIGKKADMLKWLGTSSTNVKEMKTQNDHPEHPAAEKDQLLRRIQNLEDRYSFLVELMSPEQQKIGSDQRSLSEVISDETVINGVSLQKINEFVEKLLSQSTTNFGWIPDALERRIDRRLLQLILGVIAQTLTTAAVKVGDGHQLTFSMQPHDEELKAETETSDATSTLTAGPGNLDVVVFTALKSILETVKVEFFGHNLQLHLE
jgi:hypothetical protein